MCHPGRDSPRKLCHALEAINRLRHDSQFDVNDYNLIHQDRFSGYHEIALNKRKGDNVPLSRTSFLSIASYP